MSEVVDTRVDLEFTSSDQQRLDELESVIETWINDAVRVGQALREIRDKRLYRATRQTFEEYCKIDWNMGRHYANRLIASESVTAILEPIGTTPSSEAVARELAPLKDKPEELIEAWQTAVERYGKPTAAQVRFIVNPIAHPIDPDAEEIVDDDEVVEHIDNRTAVVPSWTNDRSDSVAAVTRAVRAAVRAGATTNELYAAYQAGFH